MALRRAAAGAREAWEATSGNLEGQIGYEVFSQFEYNRSPNPSNPPPSRPRRRTWDT